MMMKLIALGNILMGDDGIAVHITRLLEDRFRELGIQVIYGETDLGYCISCIEDGDYLILLDAAAMGKQPGSITMLPLHSDELNGNDFSQHGIRLPDLLKQYYKHIDGILLGIEAAEFDFCFHISYVLAVKIDAISKELLEILLNLTEHMKRQQPYEGKV